METVQDQKHFGWASEAKSKIFGSRLFIGKKSKNLKSTIKVMSEVKVSNIRNDAYLMTIHMETVQGQNHFGWASDVKSKIFGPGPYIGKKSKNPKSGPKVLS